MALGDTSFAVYKSTGLGFLLFLKVVVVVVVVVVVIVVVIVVVVVAVLSCSHFRL